MSWIKFNLFVLKPKQPVHVSWVKVSKAGRGLAIPLYYSWNGNHANYLTATAKLEARSAKVKLARLSALIPREILDREATAMEGDLVSSPRFGEEVYHLQNNGGLMINTCMT